MRFGFYFWLGGPVDLKPECLNCISQDFFRDTPLDHIWRAQIRAWNTIFGIYGILGIFGRVFSYVKYGQVGCPWKDLAKCVGFKSIGPPSQKFWLNLIFGSNFPLQLQCKTSDRWQWIIYGSIIVNKKNMKPSFAQPTALVEDWEVETSHDIW